MIAIRPSIASDAEAIYSIAESEALFTRQDLTTVQDLFSDFINREDHGGYHFLSALQEERLVGFVCYGPTPLTSGTYDLYWIDVADNWKGRGVGKKLLSMVVEALQELGGRLLVLDTSGRQDYKPTRAFYESYGFQRSATIPDFYAPGDDLVIYTLPING
jgi:ribosomal protein S18 acetylase RimI-like enzyme